MQAIYQHTKRRARIRASPPAAPRQIVAGGGRFGKLALAGGGICQFRMSELLYHINSGKMLPLIGLVRHVDIFNLLHFE